MMPTYEEVISSLRNLMTKVHATLGQEGLQLTREAKQLLLAMTESQELLDKLHPQQQTQTTVTADPEDGSVIHL